MGKGDKMSFLGTYKVYIYITILIFLAGYFGIKQYQYEKLKADFTELKTNYKNAKEINLQNSSYIKKQEIEHQKDINMLKKIKKDNIYLNKRKESLLRIINTLPKEELTQGDKTFIRTLYPKGQK